MQSFGTKHFMVAEKSLNNNHPLEEGLNLTVLKHRLFFSLYW